MPKASFQKTRLTAHLARVLRISQTRDAILVGWLLIALATSFLAYICRVHEITHDAFHEMALVREAIATGQFPIGDVFAYTPTVSPSVHHEWGTGAVLYYASVGSGLGVSGITLLKSLLIATLWFVLYRIARLRGAHPIVFAALSMVVFPFFWVGFGTIRAQLFTLVFLSIQLWMHELDWRGKKAWIIAWWCMLVVWLNLHAGFVVGLCLIAVHGLERVGLSWQAHRSVRGLMRDSWHLLLAGLAAIVALPINPYGWQYVPYLVRAIFMKRPLIAEWSPLWNTFDPTTTLAAFGISVVLLVHALRNRQWLRLKGFANTALCACMALKHIRHGSIYGVVWIAYVPAWISHTPIGRSLSRLLLGNREPTVMVCKLVALACVSFAVAHQFWRPTLTGYCVNSETCYPTGAVDYLKRHDFRGNLMTPFHAGAYVSWELYPHVKVSLDGRYEVAYQAGVFTEHHTFYAGKAGWREIVEKYPSHAILLNRESPVLEKLAPYVCGIPCKNTLQCDTLSQKVVEANWRIVYQDDAYLVIARKGIDLPLEDLRGHPPTDRAGVAFSRAYAAHNCKAAGDAAFKGNSDCSEPDWRKACPIGMKSLTGRGWFRSISIEQPQGRKL